MVEPPERDQTLAEMAKRLEAALRGSPTTKVTGSSLPHLTPLDITSAASEPGTPEYRKGLRQAITEAVEKNERSSEKAAAPEKSPKSDFLTYADKAMFGLCELLALLFGLPFGDDLYHDKPIANIGAWHWFYLGIAALFAVTGPMWPWIRTRTWLPAGVAASFSKAPLDARLWIAALLLLFLYGTAPEIYQRATAPAASPSVIHATAEDIAKATAPIQAQLDAASHELQAEVQRAREAAKELETVRSQIADLRQQNDALRQASSQLKPTSADQTPIKWGQLGFGYQGGAEPTFIDIEIPASITGTLPVELKDAYIISGTTGARLPMMLDAGKSGKILPREAYPIPNGMSFYLTAELKPPLSTLDLLSQWGKVYFFAEYGDQKYQATFDEDYMRRHLSAYHGSPLGAHITMKPVTK